MPASMGHDTEYVHLHDQPVEQNVTDLKGQGKMVQWHMTLNQNVSQSIDFEFILTFTHK